MNHEMIMTLKEMVKMRMEELDYGNLVCDPIKVFIKREPHKAEKVRDERYRIISAVSLVDTMIDRILFRNFCDTLHDAEGPASNSFQPLNGGYTWIRRRFHGKRVLSLDKKSWDWTMSEWVIKACLMLILRLAWFDDPLFKDRWRRLAQARFTCLYRDAVFQFPDGSKVQQAFWGIQKSGCYLTLVLNSLSQWLMCVAADPEIDTEDPFLAYLSQGDDESREVPRDVEGYIKRLQELGCKVKEYHVSEPNESFEFCGFIFPRRGLPIPAYENKHMFNIAHMQVGLEVSTLMSYQLLYLGVPRIWNRITRLLRAYDPAAVRTKDKLRETWAP